MITVLSSHDSITLFILPCVCVCVCVCVTHVNFCPIHCIQPFIGVHASSKALLYCITCPVGPYFSSGTFNPVSLYADPDFIRAWPGGVGDSKMGG